MLLHDARQAQRGEVAVVVEGAEPGVGLLVIAARSRHKPPSGSGVALIAAGSFIWRNIIPKSTIRTKTHGTHRPGHRHLAHADA
jgi:hypothetical protein